MTPTSGLSASRLRRLDDAMAAYVARGEVAGLVTVVHRRGETLVGTHGLQGREAGTAMRRGSIMRIASMTKAILAVGALGLVEECRLRLDDPVDPWLPELADRRVLRAIDGPIDDTVPAERPITLRDLLTLRPGFGAIMAPPGTYPIQAAIEAAQLEPGHGAPPLPPDEWMRRLGALPLVHQPGEAWMYHTAFDVLAVLLARVAGTDLQAFLAERVFGPLGMADTGFHVPPDRIERLASLYRAGEDGGLALVDAGAGGPWASPPAFPSELVSTVDDYLAFGRMLLGGGRLGATRVLARPTVEAMATDQLTPAQKAASSFFPGFWDANGWGLGVSVVTCRDGVAGVPGRIGWDGGFATLWSVDPREDLVALMFAQREYDGVVANLHADFLTLAYQAIDD